MGYRGLTVEPGLGTVLNSERLVADRTLIPIDRPGLTRTSYGNQHQCNNNNMRLATTSPVVLDIMGVRRDAPRARTAGSIIVSNTIKASKNRLDILGISSAKKKGKGSFNLKNGWQLFYSGVDTSVYAQAGVAIMIGPNLADAMLEWKPVNERIALVRLQLQKTILTVIQVYAPNTETD